MGKVDASERSPIEEMERHTTPKTINGNGGINKIVPLSERQAFELRFKIKSYRCLTVLSEGMGA